MHKHIKNIVSLTGYGPDIVEKNIKRCHANESASPILPLDILTKNVFDEINLYPEYAYKKLIEQASNFHNTSPQNIIATNGSDEGLDLIVRSLCNAGDCVAILSPTFSMYKAICHGFWAKSGGICTIGGRFFCLMRSVFILFCQEQKAKIISIPNPLAPTGGIVSRVDIVKIL